MDIRGVMAVTLLACGGAVDKSDGLPGETGKESTADSGAVGETGDTSSSSTDTGDGGVEPEWQVPWNQVVVGGTHNSYSPERGSIADQLNSGIRCLELDIHDNDFQEVGGYQVGHYSPGDDVASSENGVGLLLREWLELIADWSGRNPGHALLSVAVDIKDNLTDNGGPEEGNLGALNETLQDVFGARLVEPAEVEGGWPRAQDLRDRVLVQLSGDATSRMRYVRDTGFRPAVAVNDKGQVIEVHDSGGGALWYWTGQLLSSGDVRWVHHGRFDTGMDPAVAITSDGWIVEVHKSESQDQLWGHAAVMDDDYRVTWFDSQKFETSGRSPSLRQQGENQFLQVNEDTGGSGGRESWSIAVDKTKGELILAAGGSTSMPLADETRSSSAAGTVWVDTFSDHESAGADTLMYGTGLIDEKRIRFGQVAFVDFQPGNSSELLSADLKFFNIKSGGLSEAQSWIQQGWLVRMWSFSAGDVDLAKHQPNCPATDEPDAVWYAKYLKDVGALR